MKVYFVRHGETKFNKAHKIMGQLNEPLDQEGIAQSHHLAEKLDLDFQRLFCSPLKRALQTAEIIKDRLHLEIEVHPELAERNFGSFAGKTLQQMDEEAKDEITKKDNNQTYDYRPYGGEAVEDVRVRVQKFLDFLKEDHADKKVLVVTHTGIIRVMYFISGQKYPDIINDSVHTFEI